MMAAAVGGLNSMARLPADGESLQSHSSGSIKSTPCLPAAPAAEKTTEEDGGHDEAGATDAGSMSAKPGPDAGTAGFVHKVAAGLGDEEGREAESTSLVPGEASSRAPEVELAESQEAGAVRPELEIGVMALKDDAAVRKTEQNADAAAGLHEDAKLPDTHGVARLEEPPLQAFTANTPSGGVDDAADSCSAAETGGSAAPPRPSAVEESKLELGGENSEAVTTVAVPAAETGVETAEQPGGSPLKGDAAVRKTEQNADAAAGLHEDAKLSDTHDVARLAEPPLQAFAANTPSGGVDDIADSCSAAETGGAAAPPRPSAVEQSKLELGGENSAEAVTTLANPAAETGVETGEQPGDSQALVGQGTESEGEAATPNSCPLKHDIKPDRETEAAQGSEANPEQEDAFIPAKCFSGAKLGYVFKMGDKGLGFYVEGYVDQPTRGASMPSHRPWNAGPGEQAIRRGPLGPIPKPFKKIVPFSTREEKKAAEESDMRPFMARMVAQKNSRGFQSSLLEREHLLDKHILHLLEKFSDPTFFKKKHGYNVHGQMLGKDGKMIVKVTPPKTEEEKAKLPWYRKVYEDRLGEHLPSKRLGDSIEARREAYAYSRNFTSELNSREEELNRALTKALKGQTKLEFITEDYHYPGAYDLHGKVILEKGAPVLNDLHRTDEQTERACTYRYKAIQRYRAAHEDIVGAIAKKDKALQKMLKHTDAATLLEISEEAVTSSGIGIYRQKNKVAGEGSMSTSGPSPNPPTERPDQLRQKFAQSLEAEIKGKDRELLKEIGALEEDEANQMIGDFGKGAEVLPSSWRQDPETLKKMQRRRKQLIAENAADRRKIVCPWRPGGKHIAQEPWQPFTPRVHRPPVRSASEGKAEAHKGGAGSTATKQDIEGRGSGDGEGAARRPHTAFMDEISPRARRVLAAQSPGTSLHSAFSTYSTDPFPLKARHRPGLQSASARSEFSTHGFPPSHAGFGPRTSNQGTEQRAWAEIPNSPTLAQDSRVGGSKRPHSAAAEISRKLPPPTRRPATACGTRDTAEGRSSNGAATDDDREVDTISSTNQGEEHELGESSRDLYVRSGPGVTVLWARLCAPSSDLIYKSSVWPRAPNASRPTRRRAKPSKKSGATRVSTASAPAAEAEAGNKRRSARPETKRSSPADRGVAEGRTGDKTGPATNGCPLEDLEDGLFASSSQRVNQRRRVFRGYAERSRRERIWDPGSSFFAEGARKHQVSGPRSCSRRTEGGAGSGVTGEPSRGSATKRKHQQDRRRVSTDVHPVDMDWEKVDIECFDGAIKEIEAALGTRLFAVATQQGQLDECFWEAQEMVASAGILLGCPENERERFKQVGPITIGSYVAMVSRLNVLWTAACGVVEIVHMIRRRRDLREVFCSEEGEQPSTEHDGTDNKGPDENHCQEHHSALPDSVTGASSQERRLVQYEKRLELAELSIAITESVKMWVSVVPWRVRVLYGGQLIPSTLRTEEETLPWPPDPGTLPNAYGENLGCGVDSESEQLKGHTQAGCETATTELYSLPNSNEDEEGRVLKAGCVS